MLSTSLTVQLHWREVDDDDPHWDYERALYAYCAPAGAQIYYIGKCDGTTVRARWRYYAKPKVWDCINSQSKTHRLIVAEIELPKGNRLSRELLGDIECLLIYRVQPVCNEQCKSSRGNHSRPGMKVQCRGAWPLSQKVFRDE